MYLAFILLNVNLKTYDNYFISFQGVVKTNQVTFIYVSVFVYF